MDPSNAFCHAMLNLDARIDFEKVGRSLLINEKLHRGGTTQMHGLAKTHAHRYRSLQRRLTLA